MRIAVIVGFILMIGLLIGCAENSTPAGKSGGIFGVDVGQEVREIQNTVDDTNGVTQQSSGAESATSTQADGREAGLGDLIATLDDVQEESVSQVGSNSGTAVSTASEKPSAIGSPPTQLSTEDASADGGTGVIPSSAQSSTSNYDLQIDDTKRTAALKRDGVEKKLDYQVASKLSSDGVRKNTKALESLWYANTVVLGTTEEDRPVTPDQTRWRVVGTYDPVTKVDTRRIVGVESHLWYRFNPAGQLVQTDTSGAIPVSVKYSKRNDNLLKPAGVFVQDGTTEREFSQGLLRFMQSSQFNRFGVTYDATVGAFTGPTKDTLVELEKNTVTVGTTRIEVDGDGEEVKISEGEGDDRTTTTYTRQQEGDRVLYTSQQGGQTLIFDQNFQQLGFREGGITFNDNFWPTSYTDGDTTVEIRRKGTSSLCDPIRDPFCIPTSQTVELVVGGKVYTDECTRRDEEAGKCAPLRDCVPKEACDQALEAFRKANTGPGLSAAYRDALAAQNLFPQVKNFEFIETFFKSTIGKFILGEPSLGICSKYTKRGGANSGYIVADDELFTLLAHIEGQRTTITKPDGSIEYFYYITYQINAPEEVSYNVDLRQGSTVGSQLLKTDGVVRKGGIESATGASAFFQYSSNFYDSLCLRMTTGTTCNVFTDVGEIPNIPAISRDEPEPAQNQEVQRDTGSRFNQI